MKMKELVDAGPVRMRRNGVLNTFVAEYDQSLPAWTLIFLAVQFGFSIKLKSPVAITQKI